MTVAKEAGGHGTRPAVMAFDAAPATPSGHRSVVWRVEQDGTGDFTVIQDAIDAAWPGDTIRIGPGRFEEYADSGDPWETYACLNIPKNLTIVGSGAGVTVIGLPVWDPLFMWYVVGIYVAGTGVQITVRDLTVVNVFDGVRGEGQDLTISDCEFRACDYGVTAGGTGRTVVERCRFLDIHTHGIISADGRLLFVSDCEFVGDGGMTSDAICCNTPQGNVIRSCRGWNLRSGIQLEFGGWATVAGCEMTAQVLALYIVEGTAAVVVDNVFTGSLRAAQCEGAYLEARRNIFNGGSDTCVWIGCPVEFHGNHLINGGGSSLRVWWYRHGLTEPYDLDVTGNYWGTGDADQIAAWIEDYHDHDPSDDRFYAIARYAPFADQPVQTQPATWGAVKALFQ